MIWTNFQVQVSVFARKWHNSHAGGSGASTTASCVPLRVSKCICAQRQGWGVFGQYGREGSSTLTPPGGSTIRLLEHKRCSCLISRRDHKPIISAVVSRLTVPNVTNNLRKVQDHEQLKAKWDLRIALHFLFSYWMTAERRLMRANPYETRPSALGMSDPIWGPLIHIFVDEKKKCEG